MSDPVVTNFLQSAMVNGCDPALLDTQIKAANPLPDATYLGVMEDAGEDVVHVYTELAPTPTELADLTVVVAAHDPLALPIVKQRKVAAIVAHTHQLIFGKTFTYDGKQFAQDQWSLFQFLSLDYYKVEMDAMGAFPMLILTAAGDDTYTLPAKEDVPPLVLSALASVNTTVGSQLPLLMAVAAATTVAEVDAVVDDRT